MMKSSHRDDIDRRRERAIQRAAFMEGFLDGVGVGHFLAESQDVKIELGSSLDDHIRTAQTRAVVKANMNRIHGRLLAAAKR